MKRNVLFAFVLAVLPAVAMAAAPPQPGPNNPCLLQPAAAELILDVYELPAKVELTLGQNVVLVRKDRPSHSSVRVTVNTTKGPADVLERLNTAAVVRKGYRIVGVFQAKNEGKGEFVLSYLDPVGSPKQKTVPFTVQGLAAASGLEGNVVSGPHKPVVRPGQSDPAQPVAGAVVVIEDANGKEVARTTADSKGNFKVTLPAGKYRVTARFPNQKGNFPLPATVDVTVPKQGYEKLKLQLDTGIRNSERPDKSSADPESELNINYKFRDGSL